MITFIILYFAFLFYTERDIMKVELRAWRIENERERRRKELKKWKKRLKD